MKWPWQRTEKRESQPFTDSVVSAIRAEAVGSVVGDPSGLAAVEAAAGLYARCFAGATVEADVDVPADVLALIGRNLIRHGESVHLIEVRDGRIRLTPAGAWDVRGPWQPASWWYRVDLFGPSGNVTRFVPAAAVVHCRYAVDSARPSHGVAPLEWARQTGNLAASLERRLAEEAAGVVAHVVPVPQDPEPDEDNPDADPLGALRSDLAKAKGGTVLTETTAAGWGEGRAAAPQADWQPRRIGANPPPVLPTLRADVFGAVLGACGVPVSLFTDADGTSQREAFRRFLTTGLEPLGELVATELAEKLETPVAFDFTGTYAHDLAGRAQAFGKLVAGGMEIEQAVAVSGLVAA